MAHENETESVIEALETAESVRYILDIAVQRTAVQLGHGPNEAISPSFFDMIADFLLTLLENCQKNGVDRIRAIAKRERWLDIRKNAAMLRGRNDDIRFRESFLITRAAFTSMAASSSDEVQSLMELVR